MKRLLCIISSLNAGGAETFLMKVFRLLPPEEYCLDFIVSEENGCYSQEVLDRGGRIFFVSPRTKNLLGACRDIASIVKKYKYTHVLKLGSCSTSVIDLLAAKAGGAQYLALRSCNALTNLSWKQKIWHISLRHVVNRVTSIKLAPSMLAAEFTFGKGQAHKNVHLIHNAVDLSVYHFDSAGRDCIRKEFSLGDRLVVGHVGRFNKQKNHRFLLKVFRRILDNNENAALLLVGGGELQEEIREQADGLGILQNVFFTGVRFDIPQVLSAMDVFVFPSFYEGMPNTVIEAQATGLPCVIADTITQEADITGLVKYLPLNATPEMWAKTALDAVERKHGNTKQAFVERGYDMEQVAREFISVIFNEHG